MSRRPIYLILNVFLMLLGVLVGLATDSVSSQAGELLRQWSLPLLGVTVLLTLAGQVWLYVMERPPSPKRTWDSSRPPYPGLEAFTEQDAGVFYGREPESNQLLDRLHPALPDQAQRFVTVIGPSGVGKSSLVQAGLLPRLAQQRSRWIVVPPLVPRDQPTRSLACSLAAALPGTRLDTLAADLAGGPAALMQCVAQLRVAGGGRSAPVLLVIDQAEELLTRTGDQERTAFLELLRAALQEDPRLWVVATLRSEFLTGFLTSGFADLFQNPVVVGSLERAALFQAIEGPAAQAGLAFAPGVVNELVDDTGGGDALPLLAYTLQALYLRVGSDGTVAGEDYRQLGGVAGALSQQADKVTAELCAADSCAPVLPTLLRFVTVDEAEPTRRRVRRSTLSDAERRVVDTFVTARLLTSDAEGGDAVIEVAHEALFRRWLPLCQAIEACADDLRQRAELERWTQDWVRSGRRDSYLLPAERLEIAHQWAAAQGDLRVELPLIHEFLDRSRRSDRAALERLSDTVARRALASVDHNPEQGVLLALAAVEECAPTLLAQRALLTALTVVHVRGVLRGHEDLVRCVAWSPDGQRIATASDDHTVWVWDAEAGTALAVLRGHEDGVRAVAWSPDGHHIATASSDRTARIWDAAAGTERAVLHGHKDWVEDVAWSPDGHHIATASTDHTVRVWDAEAGHNLAVLHGHENGVEDVAWAPDGHHIATVSRDRTARIWDAKTATEQAVLHGHKDVVRGVTWSPDGHHIATASNDLTVRVWDTDTGNNLAVLHGHQDAVEDVAWSPDSRHLATASGDRTARIWDAKTGTEQAALHGHQDVVRGVTWSPDGHHLATASYDHTARVWDAEAGTEQAVLRGHEGWVRAVAWSPDGRRIATASGDRTVRMWDAQAGTELTITGVHEDWVQGVAWSPDSRHLATASYDRTARIWDVATDLDALVAKARTRILRELTDDERKSALLPELTNQ